MATVACQPGTVTAAGAAVEVVEVIGGVDTHADTHTAAALDSAGRTLGTAQFPATDAGYQRLLSWLQGFGLLLVVGIEGTGAYGAGLARLLRSHHIVLIEVDRPDRKTRRFAGKSDPVDALAAARATLSGRQNGIPKTRDGQVEALRSLRVARRALVGHRADLQRRIKSLLVTAPEPLRARMRGLGDAELIARCAGLRPDPARLHEPIQATKHALRTLARRHRELSVEIAALDAVIDPLVAEICPALLELTGVGTQTAGQLLVTAGDNPDRLRSEAAFAMLCGAAPLPASSGRVQRYRLNRGGDRQANCALWHVALVRLRHDPRTRAYCARRISEGKSKKEILRCLKRLIAREVYYVIRPTDRRPRPA